MPTRRNFGMIMKILALLFFAVAAIFFFAIPSMTVGTGTEYKEFVCYGIGVLFVLAFLVTLRIKR